MGFWHSALRAWDVAHEIEDAVSVARKRLETGGSPLAALRAFAAATEGALDDAAVAELEAGLRVALRGLELAVAGAATVVGVLADPKARAAFDGAITAMVEGGYKASMLRIRLQSWLHEPPL